MKTKTMKELEKKTYEAPLTKHVQVEVESGICAASAYPKPNQDVGTDRHVDINQQIDGGSFDFSNDGTEWDK